MTRKLVPQLRFPEFRDAGEWEVKPLKSICSMQAGKFVAASDILEKSKGGIYPCYGGNGLRGYTKAHTHTGKYPLIGRQGALCGNVNLANGNFYATEHAVVITPKEDINVDWLFYELDLLNLNRYATGQAQPGLSVEVLEKVQSIVPAKEIEQQKIAECLGSIDDRITLETQKLAALRVHKKGLMQQLFPAEGQTLPQLRFPEFRDADEWEEKKLGEVCKIQRGKFSHRPRNEPKFFGGKYPFIQTGDVVNANGGAVRASQSLNELGLAVSKLFQPTIVLITIAANIGDTGILDHEACFTDSVVGLLPNDKTSVYFLELVMRGRKNYLNKIAPQAAQKNINNEILQGVDILIPQFSEQQKISDCLSSLDELITLQAQTIDALKLHKEGLMQQLFPSINEVSE
jgi:type I restriction enzyme, S subunit